MLNSMLLPTLRTALLVVLAAAACSGGGGGGGGGTGGHTRPFGMAYVRAPDVAPGDRGVRSSFDVAPTVFDLLGEPVSAGLSGRSLLAGVPD